MPDATFAEVTSSPVNKLFSLHDPLSRIFGSQERAARFPCNALPPVQRGAGRGNRRILGGPREPAQRAVPVDSASVRSRRRRRRALPGDPARTHALSTPAEGVRALAGRSLDGHCHGHRFGQDRVLPAPDPRVVSRATRQERSEGDRHLPDERSSSRPVATHRETDRRHPVAEEQGHCRDVRWPSGS